MFGKAPTKTICFFYIKYNFNEGNSEKLTSATLCKCHINFTNYNLKVIVIICYI